MKEMLAGAKAGTLKTGKPTEPRCLVCWFEEARMAAEAVTEAPEASVIRKQLACPMLRMARLPDALCRHEPQSAQFCDPARPPFESGPEIFAARAQTCPEVANARLSSLMYSPVPYSEFSPTWK